MKLVLVEWVDSFGCSSSWKELDEDCQPKPVTCRSVGWLFRNGKDCKVIVPHIADVPDDTSQGCGEMAIPTKSITRIVDLTSSLPGEI